MLSCMYGLVTAHFVRGCQSVVLTVVLRKSGISGLVNCTLNFEKISIKYGNFDAEYLENYTCYQKSDLIFKKFSLFSIKKLCNEKFDLGTPSWLKTGSKFFGISWVF